MSSLMEDQGQKNHVSGVEIQHHHQVQHCHKCGWPFPKPHPSAKHRRAHKRVCGTLEGYKLQDSSYTIVSDDDHSDDGDYKSPQISFKRLERSPSEDDVYSDAVSNFTDASLNSGVGGTPEIASESASAAEKFSEPEVVIPEFGASAEGTPAGILTCSVIVQAPMIAPTIDDGSGKRSDSCDLSSTIVAETKPDFPKGAPKDTESDAESLDGLLTEIKSPIENDATAEFSPNDEVKVIEQLNDTSDAAESMLQATVEVSAIADPNDPFGQSVEMPNGGKLATETPQKDISLEHSAVKESDVADFGDVVEQCGKADEGMHLFHVPPALEHPEKFIEGFKDHLKKDDVQPDNFDLEVEHSPPSAGEYNRITEEVNVFSLPQDMPVLVNQEKIIDEKMGWVGHDNRHLPNAVEEKGEVSCLASDVLLEKDGLEVKVEEVTDVVHESQHTMFPAEVTEADDRRSRNVPCVAPDCVSVIEATTHTAGECFLSGEVEFSDAPRTMILDRKDDSNSAVEIVSTCIEGDGRDKNVEHKIPAFLSFDAVTVTGAEAIMKSSGEEQEVSGTVDTRTLHLDTGGDNTISAVETSGSKKDVEFADSSSSSPLPVTEKLSRDIENDTKAVVEEERFVGLHSRVIGDFSASEIGIVHVAEDDGVRKEAAAEESGVQSSLIDVRSSLDDSIVMENREVAVVESRRKSSAANERARVYEVVAEKEQLKKGDEVDSSMNEVGGDVDKKAILLPVVGTVSQVPNLLTVLEEGGYEASLQVEDGPKQQLTASVLDASSSPSESLEANWGSVSVLSIQSDTMTPTDELREVGKLNTKQQQATAAPGKFVESSSLSSQDGDAATNDYYSPGTGRKKEEVIAKVTNWTAKQHSSSSPLKNLLVEANRETKSNNIAPTTTSKVEEKKNDTGVETKATAAAIREEWNSPARYPSEIKRDKKVKGRPYWAQFVCCSSAIN